MKFKLFITYFFDIAFLKMLFHLNSITIQRFNFFIILNGRVLTHK